MAINLTRSTTPFWLVAIVLVLTACVSQGLSTPPPVEATQITIPVAPTETVSATATPEPTLTAAPLQTIEVPTRQPNEAFWADAQKYGITSASTVGPSGEIYTAYVLTDGQWFPGMCKLYVERWDGRVQANVWHYDAARSCEFLNWDQLSLKADDRQALKLANAWSDLNQNGLPEFAVFHGSGCGGCDDWNWGHTAIYEIQGETQVNDIAANLSGEIVLVTPLWDKTAPLQVLHSQNPTAIYVTELFQYDIHRYVRLAWIYQWEGDQFSNVSSQYVTEYQKQIEQELSQIESRYGRPLQYSDTEGFWRILGLYNGSGLAQKDGLDNFLEISRPEHWPGTDALTLCWLQVMRAYTQMNYEQNEAFSIYLFDRLVSDRYFDPTLQSLGIDTTRFDVSACQVSP